MVGYMDTKKRGTSCEIPRPELVGPQGIEP